MAEVKEKLVYDIRNPSLAKATLERLTGVKDSAWKKYIGREREFKCTDDMISHVIDFEGGKIPTHLEDLSFMIIHITTSSSGCNLQKEKGVIDLQATYRLGASDLRTFLDSHGILINLDASELIYAGKEYDISYDGRFRIRKSIIEEGISRVSRKFYYDYAVCGFLSITDCPYGGKVDLRPEILADIDYMLGMDLSKKWADTHKPYEILAKVPGRKLLLDISEDMCERDKLVNYLAKAYNNAYLHINEEPIILKNDCSITPEEIQEICEKSFWS